MIIISLISLLVGVIIFEIILNGLKFYFNDFLILNSIILKQYSIIFISTVIIILLMPLLINYIFINSILKKDVNLLIKENEL